MIQCMMCGKEIDPNGTHECKIKYAGSKSALVDGSMVIVSLGDIYAGACVVCGERGEWGLASRKGPEGCKEAVQNGKIYCKRDLP